METKPKIAVLYHLFYEDTFVNVGRELQPLLDFETCFLFNICEDTPGKKSIVAALQNEFPGCYIIFTSNKGKDIGGKLALLNLFLRSKEEADLMVFLHDKKSLQALKSSRWKKDLLKIITPENCKKIIRMFRENKDTGLIATKEYIIEEPFTEGKFSGKNGIMLERLLQQYEVSSPVNSFVAGTMFWVRAKAMIDFFLQHDPLEVRMDLEDGNILDNFSGTITHSWERILSWVITSQGYSIKGI